MKFTLREMFMLVLIVSLALGWWIDRTQIGLQLGKAEQKARILMLTSVSMTGMLTKSGHTVEWGDNGVSVTSPNGGRFSHGGAGPFKELRDEFEETAKILEP